MRCLFSLTSNKALWIDWISLLISRNKNEWFVLLLSWWSLNLLVVFLYREEPLNVLRGWRKWVSDTTKHIMWKTRTRTERSPRQLPTVQRANVQSTKGIEIFFIKNCPKHFWKKLYLLFFIIYIKLCPSCVMNLFLYCNDCVQLVLNEKTIIRQCNPAVNGVKFTVIATKGNGTLSCSMVLFRAWISSLCLFSSSCCLSLALFSVASCIALCSVSCFFSSSFSFSRSEICFYKLEISFYQISPLLTLTLQIKQCPLLDK